jgi:hypothetical protein
MVAWSCASTTLSLNPGQIRTLARDRVGEQSTTIGDVRVNKSSELQLVLRDGTQMPPTDSTPVREIILKNETLYLYPRLSGDPVEAPIAMVERMNVTNPPCSVAGPVVTGIGGILLGTGAILLATAASGDKGERDEEVFDGADAATTFGHVFGGAASVGAGVVIGGLGGLIWGESCRD